MMQKQILIKNGTLVSDEYNCQKLDLLIEGKKIVRIAPLIKNTGGYKEIDATGLYVSPGFVNIHAHDDFYLDENDQKFLSCISFQGVTTSVGGNCGISNYPVSSQKAKEIDSYQGFMHYSKNHKSCSSLQEFRTRSKDKMVLNMIPLVGHGTLRVNANGFRRDLEKTAMDSMKFNFQKFLGEGGFGLSSGLMYMPGTFSTTTELIELLQSVGSPEKLFYASHLRGYSDTFLESVNEAISIARITGISTECSHLGPFGTQYRPQLYEALKMIEKANQEGVDVGFDTLGYCGGSTTIMAIVPPWFYQDGIDQFLTQIKNEYFFNNLIETMENYVPKWPSWEGKGWTDNFVHCLGWENLIVLSAEEPSFRGKNFAEIATELGISIHEAFREVIIQEKGKAVMLMAGVGTCFDESMDDMSAFDSMVEHPRGTIGIDAIFNEGGRTMPYAYGTFPKIIRRYVKEKKSLTLQEAIRKFTIAPLSRLGIHDRGKLKEQAFADLVIFDLEAVEDYPDYFSDTPKHASGVEYLFVNGGMVIENKNWRDFPRFGELLSK